MGERDVGKDMDGGLKSHSVGRLLLVSHVHTARSGPAPCVREATE